MESFLVLFLASAAVGLLEWWIVHSMPYPASTKSIVKNPLKERVGFPME
ncbi:hypothetical protein HMPREF9374_0862 [Desmospora sp. 8437]|nr:hypothetical protein HMPREF9374_0862 [Desmospora sp. 8437]